MELTINGIEFCFTRVLQNVHFYYLREAFVFVHYIMHNIENADYLIINVVEVLVLFVCKKLTEIAGTAS